MPPKSQDKINIDWIQKEVSCWVYSPEEDEKQIFNKGIIKGIVPLAYNKSNSKVMVVMQNGSTIETKAINLEKVRLSSSIERDLIDMDMINGAQVLKQLKRRLLDHKIYTFLWHSLIIVNPFKMIESQYNEHSLQYYYQHVYLNNISLKKIQPHIFSFTFHVVKQIKNTKKVQVVSICGESGSGKTQTNKQCLKAISYCFKNNSESKNQTEFKILKCDPILESFGNAKTVKNDNSSRFGKLILIQFFTNEFKIKKSTIRNFFLEKSRIIKQAYNQRNFHIFYQFLKFTTEQQKEKFKLKKKNGGSFKIQDFSYLTQKQIFDGDTMKSDKQMWTELNDAFNFLEFTTTDKQMIWSIVVSILMLGNIDFDEISLNDNDPCEIIHETLIDQIAELLRLSRKSIEYALVYNNKTIAGQLMHLPLTRKQCLQSRDSIAKAIYEVLFQWLVKQLNYRVNPKNVSTKTQKQIKLLDIYGFQVFQINSFQQLCVNYTNQRIHQIYLQKIFISQKQTLKQQGLESAIPSLNFTDNYKIIELLEVQNKSIYNLLDQSCTLNAKDDDFLANILKIHQNHEQFPPSNSVNTRKTFIIRHTPGQVQYTAQGFRDKNKDLLREDVVSKLSQSKNIILKQEFTQKLNFMLNKANILYLGKKIRKQVQELITQMSENSDLHFIRCIKPNQKKMAFTFNQRISYNQIKYLGILDTIQMRKDSYHIRMPYQNFYEKYGILEGELSRLITLSQNKLTAAQCREYSTNFIHKSYTNHNLQYLFGKQRLFMKMQTQNFFDILLQNKTKSIEQSATVLKVHYNRYKWRRQSRIIKQKVSKIQSTIRNYMITARLTRKKRAVLVIESYWIKYCEEYFNRKRRFSVMILQKYIKKSIQRNRYDQRKKATIQAKKILLACIKTHQTYKKYSQYLLIRREVQTTYLRMIWKRFQQNYTISINKYMQSWFIRHVNVDKIAHANQITYCRLNELSKDRLQQYMKAFKDKMKYQIKMGAINKIQSLYRMWRIHKKYLNLRSNALTIQRAWRNYYKCKVYSIKLTESYFSNVKDSQRSVEKKLFRNLHWEEDQKCMIEQVLQNQDYVQRDKITLFYYILDVQLLSQIQSVYPGQTWVTNYVQLFTEGINKGIPIQYVDISDTHTIAVNTNNRVYQWGLDQNNPINFNNHQNRIIVNIPFNSRISKVIAEDGYSSLYFYDSQEIFRSGKQNIPADKPSKQWNTINGSYILLNGVIYVSGGYSLKKISMPEKITQLSCGMAHCICRTSLKKVLTWGHSKQGQLGHGNYHQERNPRIMQFFIDNKLIIEQVGAGAYSSLLLDSHSKLFWCGSNGTINLLNSPKQCLLLNKSQFIDNTKKYSIVRILPRWSRNIDLLGVTLAYYPGVFKTNALTLRKKTLQNLMNKWDQSIDNIFPPYIKNIAGYFTEKCMPMCKIERKTPPAKNSQVSKSIKQKMLTDLIKMQNIQKDLLKNVHLRK